RFNSADISSEHYQGNEYPPGFRSYFGVRSLAGAALTVFLEIPSNRPSDTDTDTDTDTPPPRCKPSDLRPVHHAQPASSPARFKRHCSVFSYRRKLLERGTPA